MEKVPRGLREMEKFSRELRLRGRRGGQWVLPAAEARGAGRRSRLDRIRRFCRTVVEHFEGFLAYVRRRITNGIAQGLDSKIRLLSHRAFGLHTAEALIDRICLTCSGLRLRT